jgi:hypothetical protein
MLADEIPVDSLATDPPTQGECQRILGELREGLAGLVPAPNDVLEDTVIAWGEFAESVFFECPLGRGGHSGWDGATLELQRLRAEIDAEIEFERQHSD